MGVYAGFEEKEYETLMNASIALGASQNGTLPRIFSPGQVLELQLGYDFAAYLDPSSVTYRLLYGQFPGPAAPVFGPMMPLPVPPGAPVVNAFIQYKRPEYFTDRHRQPVWRRQSFMRFGVRSRYRVDGNAVVDHRQLEALVRLANRNPDVVVRYLCPSVWTRADLYGSFQGGRLLQESCAVDPRHLGRAGGRWHDYWTFDPLNPHVGQGNPSGPKVEIGNADSLLGSMRAKDISAPKGFVSSVDELIEVARELRHDSNVFDAPSERVVESPRRLKSKREAIEEARGFIEKSLLDDPASTRWPDGGAGGFGLTKARLLQEDRGMVQNVVEIAATAAELGLKWIVAV